LADRGDRIIVGLGEMMELGDSAAPAHQEAGRMVAEIGARYFLIMGEHANEMVKGAGESGLHRSKVEVVKSHNEMVRRIREEMRQGDLIFLKGSREMSLEKVADGLKDIYH
jgi:UDP-N-acetylmuramoyl-tripeptide--D-alanyl-D-alanine ligase